MKALLRNPHICKQASALDQKEVRRAVSKKYEIPYSRIVRLLYKNMFWRLATGLVTAGWSSDAPDSSAKEEIVKKPDVDLQFKMFRAEGAQLFRQLKYTIWFVCDQPLLHGDTFQVSAMLLCAIVG